MNAHTHRQRDPPEPTLPPLALIIGPNMTKITLAAAFIAAIALGALTTPADAVVKQICQRCHPTVLPH